MSSPLEKWLSQFVLVLFCRVFRSRANRDGSFWWVGLSDHPSSITYFHIDQYHKVEAIDEHHFPLFYRALWSWANLKDFSDVTLGIVNKSEAFIFSLDVSRMVAIRRLLNGTKAWFYKSMTINIFPRWKIGSPFGPAPSLLHERFQLLTTGELCFSQVTWNGTIVGKLLFLAGVWLPEVSNRRLLTKTLKEMNLLKFSINLNNLPFCKLRKWANLQWILLINIHRR